MSELGKNVSGDWIKATAFLGHTPELIPVLLFVEGDDDIPMWTEAVKPYISKYNISVVTNKAVNIIGGNGKGTLLTMEGLCENKLVAVDADYDLLVDNYSNYTDYVRNGQFVLNTTWYSVENILLQKMNKTSILESFSSAFYNIFIKYMATIINGSEKQPIKRFGEILKQLNVQYCVNNDDEFKSIKVRSQTDMMTQNNEIMDELKLKLTELGYTESNVWKLMRGHNLWNSIIKPLVVKEIRNKVSNRKKELIQEGKSVDRVMNELGIENSIDEYVEHEFYYGKMHGIDVPKPTREKLDRLFTMN